MTNDPHGYIAGFRRLTWLIAFAFLVVVIAIGIVLSQARSAS